MHGCPLNTSHTPLPLCLSLPCLPASILSTCIHPVFPCPRPFLPVPQSDEIRFKQDVKNQMVVDFALRGADRGEGGGAWWGGVQGCWVHVCAVLLFGGLLNVPTQVQVQWVFAHLCLLV